MKLRVLAFVIGLLALPALHAAPPEMPIDQALKLAQAHLAERGLAAGHSIDAVMLESASMTGKQRYWFARWAPSIKLDGRSELGLRINMDGSLVRLTSGGPAASAALRKGGVRSVR